MYRDHNGHEMSELHLVCKVVRNNLQDLLDQIKTSIELNTQLQATLEQQLQKVLELKTQQLQTIEQGFLEVIEQLEHRRNHIKSKFEHVYDTELAKFNQFKKRNEADSEKIHKMELVCQELSMFMDKNP